MNIHEYQAKEIFRKHGIPVSEGVVVFNPEDIVSAVNSLDTSVWVVKAQIHAGGRGKGGGVKVTTDKDKAKEYARQMFGMNLVTPQTGPEGQIVRKLYIEKGVKIIKEYYLSIVLDRSTNSIMFMASTEGGVDIEEVAKETPEKIAKVYIYQDDMWPFHARKLGFMLGFSGELLKNFVAFVGTLYKVFVDIDASQIEINPLVVTEHDKLVALDAKVNLDENSLFRQKHLAEMRDEHEEDPLEHEAKQHELSYVKMDGNIGCMVNGAGLAMATMDIIKYYGGTPANFLDVGGGATKERVATALKIILSDKSVKGILINIFGGIMRCDIIAEGVIAAAKEIGVNVPLVVRLAGTNFELGKKMLDSSGLKIVSADNLSEAAQKIVDLIK